MYKTCHVSVHCRFVQPEPMDSRNMAATWRTIPISTIYFELDTLFRKLHLTCDAFSMWCDVKLHLECDVSVHCRRVQPEPVDSRNVAAAWRTIPVLYLSKNWTHGWESCTGAMPELWITVTKCQESRWACLFSRLANCKKVLYIHGIYVWGTIHVKM